MENDCPSAKKRKNIPQDNHVDGSESNKDTCTEVVVEQGCACNDAKESLTESTLIDNVNIQEENNECKNEVVMEESQLDAPEAGGDEIRNEDGARENGYPQSGKKLLVLDVNGLLVDIVADPDEGYKPDKIIGSKAVFKRPFCDEFLKFCFEKFNVGVWTSRTRRNIEPLLKFLEIDTKQLLFCWNQFHCTRTGFNTIENSGKPLVLKELKKLWDKQDPYLPWYRGDYNETNTVFLDDSPYKALRNPPNTAIFPHSYSYRDTQDNGLGPNGNLRNYLERLAASDNVQKFIERNPFGQQPITYDDESWSFYRQIIGSNGPIAGPRSRKKLIVLDTGGLLVDLAKVLREGFKPDTMHGLTSVFKRPYCDEFLQFCFDKFNVGIWTSTSRYNTECTLDFLMGDDQHKFLFCWDRSHCTDTGFGTVENDSKPLILKDLRKLWEKYDPDLPWDIGEYDESNTLLIENTSHRALLNPPNTGIFPYPYRYWNTEDNSLGAEGDLRVYLERLAASENVQKFVSDNPFGQRPIREKNLSWKYYQKVIQPFSFRLKGRSNGSGDARYKKTSEPKPETTSALAAPTLAEPKPNSTTASAAPTILEPETNATISDAQTSLEPQSDTPMLDAQTSLEPETDTTIPDVQTTLEPEPDTTIPHAQTALEPESDTTTTILDAQTSLDTETDTAIPDAQISLEPETDTSIPDAQTSIKPETDTSIPDAQTSIKPETDEPETDTAIPDAQTSLEPETDTTIIPDAQTSMKPETDSTTVLAAQTSLEPQTETNTFLAAPN